MTTMVIEPIYSDNRSEDGAYGCSCICNVQSYSYDELKEDVCVHSYGMK